MNKKNIPIVFATDDNYALYLYVEIFSLIKHSNRNRIYDIFVFMTRLSKTNVNLLEGLSVENVNVKCIDISEYVEGMELHGSLHISVETMYRFFIPLVLKEYEKIIYLDTDMILLHDIADFYDSDISGFAIGAMLDVPCSRLEEHYKKLGGYDCRRTFNAGVLLINNHEFEKQNVRQKGLELLWEDDKRKDRRMLYTDQDALNSVLYNNFKILNPKWNFQGQYLWRTDAVFEEYRDRYMETSEKPFILHYAGDKKPWSYPELPKADIFWKLAAETDVYQQIVFKSIIENRIEKVKYRCFDSYRFPYGEIPFKSKIAIYGAGEVGRTLYNQMKLGKYAEVVLWVDKNYENLQGKLPVKAIEQLVKQNDAYEYIVVAIDDEKIAAQVINAIKGMGIDSAKVKWYR